MIRVGGRVFQAEGTTCEKARRRGSNAEFKGRRMRGKTPSQKEASGYSLCSFVGVIGWILNRRVLSGRMAQGGLTFRVLSLVSLREKG